MSLPRGVGGPVGGIMSSTGGPMLGGRGGAGLTLPSPGCAGLGPPKPEWAGLGAGLGAPW